MVFIFEEYKKIKEHAGRAKVIVVTKYSNANEIIEAYNAGIRDFAEGKAQDAEKKREEMDSKIEKNLNWHFIGHLQSNKVKKVVGKYSLIHSVDSLELAEKINQKAKDMNLIQDILLQVNVSREENKHGFSPEAIFNAFENIRDMKNVRVQGLMGMAADSSDGEIVRKSFRELRELKEKIEGFFPCCLAELSMGMSNDYKIALEEGATMIRIGSKLFKG